MNGKRFLACNKMIKNLNMSVIENAVSARQTKGLDCVFRLCLDFVLL